MSATLLRTLALLTLAALTANAKPAKAPLKKKPAATRQRQRVISPFGEVSSVAGGAAYLNRGVVDGLKPGQTLTFTRGNKAAGTCIVATLSEHFARCESATLRVGDRFAVARTEALTPLGPTALPSEAELRRRGAMVDGAGWRLRDFDVVGSDAASALRVEAALSHTTFYGGQGGPFGVQRIDLLIPDFEIWKGLRVSADLSVLNFSARPAETRTVYQQTPLLLVRQLEVGFRRSDLPFSAALGRTWLRAGTGLLAIDGAQAAWRFGEGVEVGAWGGLLPEAARLTIQPSQWSMGAFARTRLSSGTGASATLFQASLRGGYSQRDLLGGRAELGLSASLWVGAAFDANLGAEFGFGQTQAPAGLDAARLDLGWRPSERLRFSGGVRYRGLPLTGLQETGTVSPGQRALHADAGGTWQVTPRLWVALVSGLASDFDAQLWQLRVGPELLLPSLFELPLHLGIGYVEEVGWLRGRHGYAQLQLTPGSLLRLTTRLNWFHQQASPPTPGVQGHELGASMALEVTPWRFLRGRVAFLGRVPLRPEASPLGSVQVQLAGGW